MRTLLILCLGFVLYFGIGEAIQCYQCVGAGKNCFDGSCQGPFCFKNVADVGGTQSVTKGCQDTGSNSCETGAVQGIAGGGKCTCNSNWCNASVRKSQIAMNLLVLACGAALAMKFV